MFKKIKKETILVYLPFLFLFLYLLYTNQSVSLMADDFRYSMRSCFNWVLPQERITNIFHIFQTAYYDYMVDCARYGTAMLIYTVLLFGSKLFQILNPIIFTVISIFISFLVLKRFPSKKQDILVTISVVSLFFFCPSIVMDEAVYWITGAISYGWPVLYFILFLLPFLPEWKDYEIFKKPIVIVGYVFLAFMAGSTVENYSITFSCIILFLIIYNIFYLKDKQYLKGIRLISILLFIFNFVEIMSPGTANRLDTFGLTFIQKTFQGFFAFVQYQYILSGLFIVIFLITLLLFIRKYKFLLVPSIVLFLPLIILNILINIKGLYFISSIEPIAYFVMPLDYFEWKKMIMFDWLWIVSFYYVTVTLMIIIDVCYLSIKHNDLTYFVLNMMACFSLLALCGSGAGSTRVSFLALTFLGICSIYVIVNYLKCNIKLILLVLIFGLYGMLVLNIYIFDNVKVGIERNKIFDSIDENTKGDVILPKYRYSIHGNFTDFWSWEFQEAEIYFGINQKPDVGFKFEE